MKRLAVLLPALVVSVGLMFGAWGYVPAPRPTCTTSYGCIEAE